MGQNCKDQFAIAAESMLSMKKFGDAQWDVDSNRVVWFEKNVKGSGFIKETFYSNNGKPFNVGSLFKSDGQAEILKKIAKEGYTTIIYGAAHHEETKSTFSIFENF